MNRMNEDLKDHASFCPIGKVMGFVQKSRSTDGHQNKPSARVFLSVNKTLFEANPIKIYLMELYFRYQGGLETFNKLLSPITLFLDP